MNAMKMQEVTYGDFYVFLFYFNGINVMCREEEALKWLCFLGFELELCFKWCFLLIGMDG